MEQKINQKEIERNGLSEALGEYMDCLDNAILFGDREQIKACCSLVAQVLAQMYYLDKSAGLKFEEETEVEK